LPVSVSMGPVLAAVKVPAHATPLDGRALWMCVLALPIGAAAGLAAEALLWLIAFITRVSFYGQWQSAGGAVDPRQTAMGLWIVLVPVAGAIVVGLLARYGSPAVAGHGIPEAMEQVLRNQSRIPARMMFLKPLSAAVSIGTGGPFGAEGPIIATGGAMGSVVGQLLPTSASERKVLLSAGAAAGIAAAFGTPVAAVLLAIELLLFEFRPRSILPVALASAVATAMHAHMDGSGAMFPFVGAAVSAPGDWSLFLYTVLGAVIGLGAVVLTRTVYAVEAAFEHLPVHWMWRPAFGAVVVGVVGWCDPGILGPGYFNLRDLLAGTLVLKAAGVMCALKFLAWTVSLGSGTSGGTLAPVFTIGGSLAAVLVMLGRGLPWMAGVDVRVAALVGMVAIFAGASRAFLTSVVFAVEITHEQNAILPVVCGCAAAYVVSALLMRHSIMTDKMARQGVRVPVEYGADALEQRLVAEVMARSPVTLAAGETVGRVRSWIGSGVAGTSHQGYPVVDEAGNLCGVVTRRDIFDPVAAAGALVMSLVRRAPVVVYADCSLRDAVDHMVNHKIGRVPVIERGTTGKLIGIVTRGDVISAWRRK
jgi:H+/Cl- antiporter ClcA